METVTRRDGEVESRRDWKMVKWRGGRTESTSFTSIDFHQLSQTNQSDGTQTTRQKDRDKETDIHKRQGGRSEGTIV